MKIFKKILLNTVIFIIQVIDLINKPLRNYCIKELQKQAIEKAFRK